MKRNIYISQPVLGQEEWEALREPLESGWVTSGPKVREFEEAFAELHGVKHAVAVTSCTTGLHLALAALGIQEGDEVLLPAFTWVATANVVRYCGAKPVLVDVDMKTFNIDPSDIAHRITDKTKAIIPVHLFGLCADMDAIRKAAPGLPIVEDAACAAGASFNGTFAGGLGDMASFSFHPRKSITTGEGGMVTTNSDDLAELLIKLRNHGAEISEEQRHHGPKPYLLPDFNLMGFNYRMTDLQGTVGCIQIKKLKQFIAERQQWANFYFEELGAIEWLQLPVVPEGYSHGWQSFVALVDEDKAPMKRNDLMELLQEKGISTRPGTHAVHTLGYYQELYGYKAEDYPGASICENQSLAIPLHNRMTEEDFRYLVDVFKSI